MVKARETLIQEEIDRTEKIIKELQGKEGEKEEAEVFTEDQEKIIKANMEAYKDKTREQVIDALKQQGVI